MKATLTTCTFEMMYYETRGGYCNPAEKFLNYTEFKKMFEPVMFGNSAADEAATTIYNKAIDNGATEEAALHAALFVFSFTAGKQAAKKWFDGLVAKQSENDNPDDSNPATPATPAQTPELAAAFKHAFVQTASFVSILSSLRLKKDSKLRAFVNEYRIDAVTAIKQLSKKSNDLNNAAAAKELRILSKALIAAVDSDDIETLIPIINYVNATNDDSKTVFITIFAMLQNSGYLPGSKPEEDPKDPDDPTEGPSDSGAAIDPAEEIFESEDIETPTVANDIDPVKDFMSLKTLTDDLYRTTNQHEAKNKASMILDRMHKIADALSSKSNISTEEYQIFRYINTLEKVVHVVEPMQLHLVVPVSYSNFVEAEDKDLAIKNISKIVNVRSEIRSPLEIIATTSGDPTPTNKKPIPDVEEACLFNGKEFSDSDLSTILKNKVTVLGNRNVSRNSINMLLNLVMNNKDGFVKKLIDLGAKTPLEIKEVKVSKYTTDKKRFDTVFEVTTANVNAPIVFFYHWDPILNKEGTAWAYDALVLPFDKVTLTKDAKKAKADSKRQKKTKKQTTEQPAPQPQAMTATA